MPIAHTVSRSESFISFAAATAAPMPAAMLVM
jgi:hypothetical protein